MLAPDWGLNYSTMNESQLRNILSFTQLGYDNGNTHPYEVERILNYVGLTSIHSEIYFGTNFFDVPRLSNAIDIDLIPLLFETHKLTGTPYFSERIFGIHFIQLDQINMNGFNVDFTYRHYGDPPIKTSKSLINFSRGLKAYWIPVELYK